MGDILTALNMIFVPLNLVCLWALPLAACRA